jgi:hypothetical protein
MSQAITTEYKHILLGDRDVPFIFCEREDPRLLR